ncbi:MAG: biotin--[acetyl-CoA-carboxylase] ligase [Anaerolineae bacterium]
MTDEIVDELLSPAALLAGMPTRRLGRPLVYHRVIDSTNEEARRLAAAGSPEGTLIIAESQTAGRGRRGRRWAAPAGRCLLFSLLLRPALPSERLFALTMAAGLAVRGAIIDQLGLVPALKWPNDVYIAGRKAAGILVESAFAGQELEFAVVGIGINVNVRPEELIETVSGSAADPTLAQLSRTATSLMVEAGRPVSRPALLWDILRQFEGWYERILAGESPLEEWKGALMEWGREVVIEAGGERISGRVVDTAANGALGLALPDGQVRWFHAGEASLRPRPAGAEDNLPESA